MDPQTAIRLHTSGYTSAMDLSYVHHTIKTVIVMQSSSATVTSSHELPQRGHLISSM